ncbi:hypothetical protein JXJ21_25860 [candidate division KSB1 bacterium]|nr:hypothetical protein [candidate division KSB1 bacterium]
MNSGSLKAVVTGQPGSGKSTELSRIAQILEHEFFIVWLNVDSQLDIFSVNHLEVLIAAFASMYKIAHRLGLTITKKPLEKVVETVNKVTSKKGFALDLTTPKLLDMAGITFKFGLNWETVREINVEPEISDLLAYIDDGIEALKDQTGYCPLWIIDGLDKVEYNMARYIFAESRLLAYPSCIILYTVPFALFHSPHFQRIRNYFSGTASRELPNILPDNGEVPGDTSERRSFFEQLTENRLVSARAAGFIENQALKLMIGKCGGIIREFIYLVQYATQEARRMKLKKIDSTLALRAIERMKREKMRGLTQERVNLLCKLYHDRPKVLPGDSTSEKILFELLQNLYILYYENGESWYWTHPILNDFFEQECS